MRKKCYKLSILFGTFLVFMMTMAATQSLNAQPFYGQAGKETAQPNPISVKEFQLQGHGTINVFTAWGDIDLKSVPDTKKVRIELYADRGFTIWPRSDPFENYRITTIKRGDEITASVERKSVHDSGFWSSQTSFSYKITVPQSVSTNLKTSNGHIILSNVNGRQTLKANIGDIRVADVNGMVTAYTAGGNIFIDNSNGTVYAKADGGKISVKHSNGELRLKSNGGEIISSDISGSMVAEVSGGNIDAQFDDVIEGISLTANAGNISLVVPKSNGYKLYIHGDEINFDRAGIFQGTYSQQMADGAINGGGTPLNLTANAGTVSLQLKK